MAYKLRAKQFAGMMRMNVNTLKKWSAELEKNHGYQFIYMDKNRVYNEKEVALFTRINELKDNNTTNLTLGEVFARAVKEANENAQIAPETAFKGEEGQRLSGDIMNVLGGISAELEVLRAENRELQEKLSALNQNVITTYNAVSDVMENQQFIHAEVVANYLILDDFVRKVKGNTLQDKEHYLDTARIVAGDEIIVAPKVKTG